jgi:L-fuconolactonase
VIVLDAQVHSWYSDRPDRPWASQYRDAHRHKQSYLQHAGQTNSPDMVLDEMARVGVNGALLTPVGVYGTDLALELEAAEQFPDHFQVVGLIDHLDQNLSNHLEMARSRGLRGVRLLGLREPDRVTRGEFDPVLRLCADFGLVVTLSLAHPLDPQLPELFRRNPRVFFYVDHLGTGFAPPILGFRPEAGFEHLPAVLELAVIPNVGIKLTGAPALSLQSYPFKDIWEPIRRLIDAFGADRVSWGSDFSRTAALHSYWEGTHYLGEMPGVSSEQLNLVYGETLMHRTGWNPSARSQLLRKDNPWH